MIHENVIEKIWDKARKQPAEQNSPRESILKQFEAYILKYAAQNYDAMVQQMKSQHQNNMSQIMNENRVFKICINLTKMLGLSDNLYRAIEVFSNDEVARKEY